ncbi:MAG TPA: outer membrane beta-barrel family protein [Parafilimonas sp.]|nr:outer membrane beta-barrel family protein [Parafilimonas sp.]
MKKLFTAVLIIVSSHLVAQFPVGGKAQKAPPSIGHIYGKVVDSADKPIAQASIILLQNKFDSSTKKMKQILFKGATTEANGDFDFGELPLFGITMKISAVGYKPYEEKITFQLKAPGGNNSQGNQMQQGMAMMSALDKDMGNIKLAGDVGQLQNVTVSTTASALKMDIDKKTFNVDKNIVSAGGTAIDVMKNVPSVQVDIDGNVKVRNATPQIYIDGRPTTLTLDQIPADAIQSVEVITNPSAKYDASGGNAGILNIILKKNKQIGYNGNLMAGIDSRGGFNGGGNFNVRQGKINFSAALMANHRNGRTTGNTIQDYLFDTVSHNTQSTVSKNDGTFMFGRLGLDYFVTNRTTLSLSGIKVHGEFQPNSVNNTFTEEIFKNGDVINSSSIRATTGSRTFNANGLQFAMVHNFPKQGEQWTIDGNYFAGKNNGNSYIAISNYDGAGNYIGPSDERQLSTGDNKFFTVQTDYTNPLTKNTKLETGLRAQMNKLANINDLYYVNGSVETKRPGSSINYHNTNNVYAAYATITSSIKNFGYEIGLRAESSDYTGIVNDSAHYTHNYPVSLFPSIFLSQKLKNRQELQLNFSRRINRPNFFQLIPYTDRSDTLNITRGNPDLVPEFTNSFEFSYSKTYGKNNMFLTSVYYKHTNHLITRYQDSDYNSDFQKTELINTYINANSSYAYGLELTDVDYVNKWWDFNANVNLYNSKINAGNNIASQDAILSWFGKMNNNFKLPKNFTLQLSGNYQSKTNLPVSSGQQNFGPPQSGQSASQGYIKPFWSVDFAVKKTFFKNQAGAITLSVNDIFRTAISEQISSSPFFYQDYSRLNNPQLVRLNFTYHFGKFDVSLFKRQSKNSNQGLQEGMQMGGGR